LMRNPTYIYRYIYIYPHLTFFMCSTVIMNVYCIGSVKKNKKQFPADNFIYKLSELIFFFMLEFTLHLRLVRLRCGIVVVALTCICMTGSKASTRHCSQVSLLNVCLRLQLLFFSSPAVRCTDTVVDTRMRQFTRPHQQHVSKNPLHVLNLHNRPIREQLIKIKLEHESTLLPQCVLLFCLMRLTHTLSHTPSVICGPTSYYITFI